MSVQSDKSSIFIKDISKLNESFGSTNSDFFKPNSSRRRTTVDSVNFESNINY